jgi:uncharacterized membrane protein
MLFLQWIYACSQAGMLASFVTRDHRDLVRSRFLAYPAVAIFTMLICFWSIEISLSVYMLLLPLYMIPGRIVTNVTK